MKIVIASCNQGKLLEMNSILFDEQFSLISQPQLQITEALETGATFVENALIKARHVCQHTNLPAIADDSGLIVDALDNEPGVYSARYAGPKATYEQNITKLLHKLHDIPEKKRTARFVCVIVFLKSIEDPIPIICYGTMEGKITFSPKGTNGFGYDPIFWITKHKCTAAQLTTEEKNRLSQPPNK
jgi:XTP/dITP diphosphohydrolase